MIVIANASPLIALSQAQCLGILKALFGRLCIPDSVYQETVIDCPVALQKQGVLMAIDDFIQVQQPTVNYPFSRNLGNGERGVLNLAIEKKAELLLIDDKKARNEAKDLGFTCGFTSDVLYYAERQRLIQSYANIVQTLRDFGIYLP
jgi:predicted nucleic acid-binding protein